MGPKPCESLRRCDGVCSAVFSVAVVVVERTDTRADSDVRAALSLTSWLNLGKLQSPFLFFGFFFLCLFYLLGDDMAKQIQIQLLFNNFIQSQWRLWIDYINSIISIQLKPMRPTTNIYA